MDFSGFSLSRYEDFLQARRELMADVARRAFDLLRSHAYTTPENVPSGPPAADPSVTEVDATLADLIEADLLPAGTELITTNDQGEMRASVLPDGRVHYDDETFGTLLELSESLELSATPWQAWAADLPEGRVRLAVLREQLTEGAND